MKSLLNQKQISHAMNILRAASYRSSGRNIAMRNARVARGKYKCAACGGVFGRKQIQMDHIVPVIDPEKGWETLEHAYLRLEFFNPDAYQCLCKDCHNKKSAKENIKRRGRKK